MDLCVSMWSMHRKFYNEGWTVLNFLEFCAGHGIQSVELLDVFWRDQESEIEQVQAFFRDHAGMKVAAYAVTNDFVNIDPEKRAEAVQSVLTGIQVAKRLGTNTVRVFAGDLKDGYSFDSASHWIIDGLRIAANEAGAEGVTLGVENHGKLAGRGDQIRDLLDAVGSPALLSTFDTGNFLLVDQGPLDAFKQLTGRIGHVHVKDFVKSDPGQGLSSLSGQYYNGTICGQGEVPLPSLLQKLNDSGYVGAVSLEFEGEGDEAPAVLQSVAYLQRHL